VEQQTDDYVRLGVAVRQRRRELRLTQEEVRELGGPSTATVRLIEKGEPTDLRRGTVEQLEKALQWETGSVELIMLGEKPIPLVPESVRPSDDTSGVLASLPPEALEGLGAAERAEVVAAMRLRGLERAREVRRRLDAEGG
jgi:transcriptional regulator with XRE-family HTH domain